MMSNFKGKKTKNKKKPPKNKKQKQNWAIKESADGGTEIYSRT